MTYFPVARKLQAMYLAVFLAWPCPAVSSTQEAAATSSRGATLTDFASLAGGWEAHLGPMTAERQWMAPRNGTMQGFFRLTDAEKTLVIELFTIRATSPTPTANLTPSKSPTTS